jgi:GH24 family phage-related lysozyme (muramidase)
MNYEAIESALKKRTKYSLNTPSAARKWLTNHLHVKLEDYQELALVSFLTTVSLAGQHKSLWLEHVNNGDLFQAADEMYTYVIVNDKVNGYLKRRRLAETELLLDIKLVRNL